MLLFLLNTLVSAALGAAVAAVYLTNDYYARLQERRRELHDLRNENHAMALRLQRIDRAAAKAAVHAPALQPAADPAD